MLPVTRSPFPRPLRLVFRGLACAALLLESAGGQTPPAKAAGGGSLSSGAQGGSAYGLLWLDVDSEKVEIALDGLYLDRDVWLISIPPGTHEIRVRKPGFKAYESRFGIVAGQNLHLDVHLEPDHDSLSRLPG